MRVVDDRIDLLIAVDDFKRPAPDAESTLILQTLGVPHTASATVRKAAERFLNDCRIAAILDPVKALLRERALPIRYRQEAELARRYPVQHRATVGGDDIDVALWPRSDQN